ncbi:DNA topoisomerase IB [Stakelama sediminis]|uniref:DNA topoisomerase n=1 Tax=Stakelama sediminis TaxID=463200 RepID=A0A840Z1C1_9SPHN|nr:DNA topoisomerase IB [Stakelama sediminis]MBB5719516.1 DNA topoisomerase-1 [Stakelama sediminis]
MTTAIRYCDDSQPGITRRKSGKGWSYRDAQGKRITDRQEIDRLNAIALPPAYRDAWFCPDPRGHIQATGYDEAGRKQYRYHPDFREARESEKYERMIDFGERLPALRKQVAADLRRHDLCRERAVAAVIRLLDLGHVRVGNEGYARANKSFGATTLRKRHGKVTGNTLRLKYRAKSGKERVMRVTDGSLSRFIKRCQDLPGQHLFHYLDANGKSHPVTSTDVNDYIHAAMGEAFSAKHFRTWGASVLAFEALSGCNDDLTLKAMLEPVVDALGNTPAVARKSYVHPALIDLCKQGQERFRENLRLPRSTRHLSACERALIEFLMAEDAALTGGPAKAA